MGGCEISVSIGKKEGKDIGGGHSHQGPEGVNGDFPVFRGYMRGYRREMETLFIEKIGERHNDKEDNYSRSRFPDISSHPEKILIS
jgi:hypothetical protein